MVQDKQRQLLEEFADDWKSTKADRKEQAEELVAANKFRLALLDEKKRISNKSQILRQSWNIQSNTVFRGVARP